ncbi:restriction endonuclease subunit S [Paenibacillus tarimensis]
MNRVKFADVVIRANTKEDKDNTEKELYVGGEHILSGEVLIKNCGVIEGSTIGPMFYFGFKAGQVLFVSRNPHLKKAGMVTFDGICSEKTFVLESKDENVLLQRYLPFVLQSNDFWTYAEANKSGSVNYFINWSTLAKYEFDLPSITVQRELSNLLWAIENTKQAYRKLLQKTDELVKSQFIEMFGDPVTNTQNRQVVPFKDFMTDIRYGTSKPPAFSESGSYKFIRATNIKMGRIIDKDMLRIDSTEAAKIEKCKLKGNEMIIVRSGANTGDTCVVTNEYSGQYAGYDIIITFDSKKANPIFFNELINTHYMKMRVKPLTARAAQPHINSEQVQNLPMIVAPIELQNEFEAFVRQSDKSKYELEQALKELDSTYKRIISENLG